MPKPPKTAQTSKPSGKQADAVHMLKADHKHVKQLFERFRSASSDEQPKVARELFTELDIHTKLEEELFYPALREKLKPVGALDTAAEEDGLDVVEEVALEEEGEEDALDGVDIDDMDTDDDEAEDQELITVAYDEHQAAKDLIEQLKTLDPKGADYQELFAELEEAVIEHVTGVEDILLPLAASELDVRALGAQMQRRRDDLLSSLAA